MTSRLNYASGETLIAVVSAADRAWVRSLAQQIACDIHPLNNLRVLKYLERNLGVNPAQRQQWVAYWISTGFAALETRLAADRRTGRCCYGDTPTMADCCLVPQMFNARHFGVALGSTTVWRAGFNNP